MKKLMLIVFAAMLAGCSSLPTNPLSGIEVTGANVVMTVIAAKSGVMTGNCTAPIPAVDVGAACAALPPTATTAQVQAALQACIAADLSGQVANLLAKYQAAICARAVPATSVIILPTK